MIFSIVRSSQTGTRQETIDHGLLALHHRLKCTLPALSYDINSHFITTKPTNWVRVMVQWSVVESKLIMSTGIWVQYPENTPL